MNDIEKKLRKRGMAKLNQFAKNPYKVKKKSWFERIPLWTKVVIPTAVLTTALFMVVVSTFSIDMFSPKGRVTDSSQKPGAVSSVPQTSQPTSGKAPGHTSSNPGKASSQTAATSRPDPGEKSSDTGWKALPVYQKFPTFSYEGIDYRTSTGGNNQTSEYNIDTKLDDIVLTAIDDIGVDRYIDAGVFSLKYTPQQQVVALRFSTDDVYYIYFATTSL